MQVEVWEGVLTFLFFPALLGVAYAADKDMGAPHPIGTRAHPDTTRARGHEHTRTAAARDLACRLAAIAPARS
jgi:hypothetical protein